MTAAQAATVLASVSLATLAAGSGLLACVYLDQRAQSFTRAMRGYAARRVVAYAFFAATLAAAAFAVALA